MLLTREQLISQLDEAREQMRSLIQKLDPQNEIYPGWKVKELLAHIAGWDDSCIASLRAHMTNDLPTTPAAAGIDPFNAVSVSERATRSTEQVQSEWEQSREILKELIRDLPEEKLDQPFVFPWGQVGTLEIMVRVFAEHEIEHVDEIRSLLNQKDRAVPTGE